MDKYLTLIPATFALLGTIVGGLITFLTTYYLKTKEWKLQNLNKEIERKEKLYSDFMAECGRLVMVGVDADLKKTTEFSHALKLLNQIQITASDDVVEASTNLYKFATKNAVKGYKDKSKTEETPVDLPKYGLVCRAELDALRKKY